MDAASVSSNVMAASINLARLNAQARLHMDKASRLIGDLVGSERASTKYGRVGRLVYGFEAQVLFDDLRHVFFDHIHVL